MPSYTYVITCQVPTMVLLTATIPKVYVSAMKILWCFEEDYELLEKSQTQYLFGGEYCRLLCYSYG